MGLAVQIQLLERGCSVIRHGKQTRHAIVEKFSAFLLIVKESEKRLFNSRLIRHK
jgi:hypothetical protein